MFQKLLRRLECLGELVSHILRFLMLPHSVTSETRRNVICNELAGIIALQIPPNLVKSEEDEYWIDAVLLFQQLHLIVFCEEQENFCACDKVDFLCIWDRCFLTSVTNVLLVLQAHFLNTSMWHQPAEVCRYWRQLLADSYNTPGLSFRRDLLSFLGALNFLSIAGRQPARLQFFSRQIALLSWNRIPLHNF